MNDEYDFPTVLLDGIWHSTSIDRYSAILETGSILPEPNIPNSERWSTSKGERYYPFVRSIGGISLFDFRSFKVSDYNEVHGVAKWATFVPGRVNWDSTIWIELKVDELSNDYFCPNEIMDKWHESKEYRQVIPRIESAYIGEIPISMIKRVLKYSSISDEFIEYEV